MNTGKTILLAVSGMSPAILTETVWALAKEKPAVIPDEVVVLTTTRGAADIQSQILAPRAEWSGISPWAALRSVVLGAKTAAAPRLQFSAPRIIELPDAATGVKRPADDLRTPEDNAAAADFILEEVRRLTENPDIRVIASIAGGRKTMGALLYAAMSLLGRETDRLTHVLVNEPFDRCRDFFFPGQPVREISISGAATDAKRRPDFQNRKIKAAEAQVDLADIPFVPLRNLFERDLASRPGSFASLVAAASRQISNVPPGRVEVSLNEPVIRVDGVEVRFTPREHVLLIQLARDCVEGRPAYPDHEKAHAAFQATAADLRSEVKDVFHDWRANIPKTTTAEDIRKIVSSIRTKLKKSGGAALRLERSLDSRRSLAFLLGAETFVLC